MSTKCIYVDKVHDLRNTSFLMSSVNRKICAISLRRLCLTSFCSVTTQGKKKRDGRCIGLKDWTGLLQASLRLVFVHLEMKIQGQRSWRISDSHIFWWFKKKMCWTKREYFNFPRKCCTNFILHCLCKIGAQSTFLNIVMQTFTHRFFSHFPRKQS